MLTLDTTESSGFFVPSALLCLQKEWETRYGNWELWNYFRTENGSKGQSIGKEVSGRKCNFSFTASESGKVFERNNDSHLCLCIFSSQKKHPPYLERYTQLTSAALKKEVKRTKAKFWSSTPILRVSQGLHLLHTVYQQGFLFFIFSWILILCYDLNLNHSNNHKLLDSTLLQFHWCHCALVWCT